MHEIPMMIARMSNSRLSKACLTALMLAMLNIVAGGCAALRVTDPARTASEQFLLSTAASKAVEQLSFDLLRDRVVYVDTSYFAASDQAFVLGELRARLLLAGVQITSDRDQAEIIVEVRSGGVGIDRYDSLLGLPSVFL